MQKEKAVRLMLLAVLPGLLLACTRAERAAPATTRFTAPLPENGKMMAPVSAEVDLSQTSAHVTLRFESDGTNVSAEVSGVDGLTVAGATKPIAAASVARGEARSFDVAFSSGPERSNLVVSVSGTFGGATLFRVMTFAVAGESPRVPPPQSPGDGVKGVPSGG